MNQHYRERIFDFIVIGIVLVCLAFMSGCSAFGGALVIKVPIAISCQEKMPVRPIMPTEGLQPGGSLYRTTIAMQAEIERRQGYETKLETALEACIAPIQPSTPSK